MVFQSDFSSKILLSAAAFVVTVLPSASAQTQTPAAANPVFEVEVATIKLNKSNVNPSLAFAPDGFTATNYSLHDFIRKAYELDEFQLLGEPEWLKSERYDINAKFDKSMSDALPKFSSEQVRHAREHVGQKLVEDRLQFKYHRETRELPIYALVVAKSGSRLQAAKPAEAGQAGHIRRGWGHLMVQGVPLDVVAQNLSEAVGRTVVDKTGLKGNFDFALQWTPEGAAPGFVGPGANQGQPAGAPIPEASGPTIFTAIQEQLGLKLEPQKGPVEVMVIDHIERPSAN